MTEEIFTFPSSDKKTIIHAVRWLPEDGCFRYILQIAHGMIEYIERYREFAEYMTAQGVMVVGHDHLGHGASVASEKDWGYFAPEHPSDILIEDMHTLRKVIQNENTQVPYFMMGHSMGSYMLRKYLCIHPENITGAVILGTGYIGPKKLRQGWLLCKVLSVFFGERHISRIAEAATFDKNYSQYDLTGKNPRKSWLSKNEASVREYFEEPRCTFKFTVNGYRCLLEAAEYDADLIHVQQMPKNIPVFMASGQEDPVGECGAGVKKVYDLFKTAGMADVTCKLYAGDRHELLQEIDRDMVFEDICAWIKSKADKATA